MQLDRRDSVVARTPFAAALVAAAVLAAYAPIFFSEFVFDGRLVAGDNPAIANLANLRLLFSADYYRTFGENTYRPLVSLTYLIDAAIWGVRKPGFAATSLLIHFAAAWALLVVVRRRAGGDAGLAAALVFAAHPAISEAVFCVGHRETLLGGFFVFAVIALWDRARDGDAIGPFVVAVAVYALGLFAIESVILVPLYLIIERAFSLGRIPNRGRATLAVMLLVAVAYWSSRGVWFPGTRPEEPFYGGSRGAAALAAVEFVGRYVGLLVWPATLRPDYGGVETVVGSRYFILGAMAIVLGVLAATTRRALDATRAGIAWAGLSMVPVLHLVTPFWIPMAERYLYVAVGAAAMAASTLWAPVATGENARRRRLAWAALVVVVLLAIVRTHTRGWEWRSDAALWAAAVRDQPASVTAWTNLAQARLRSGDVDGRREALARLTELRPEDIGPAVALADLEADRGDRKAALLALARLNARRGGDGAFMEALATWHLRRGDTESAWEVIDEMDVHGVDLLTTSRARVQYHVAMGEWETTARAVDVCLAEDPEDAICLQFSGVVKSKAGMRCEAAEDFAHCARVAGDEALRRACLDAASLLASR